MQTNLLNGDQSIEVTAPTCGRKLKVFSSLLISEGNNSSTTGGDFIISFKRRINIQLIKQFD